MSANLEKAKSLVAQNLVWDMVWPVNLLWVEPWGNDWAALDALYAAGVKMQSITLAGDDHGPLDALHLVSWARSYITSHPDKYVLVERVADVDRAMAEGKMAVGLHFEGTRPFDRNLELIETFHKLGIRQTIMAFNAPNCAGGGCALPDGGLTAYGRSVLKEMERVGMSIDISHTGERTSFDIIEASTRPVVSSHSNAAAIHPHMRNLSDDLAKACVATGGVLGLSGGSDYMGDHLARPETLFRHIDHYTSLVGADNVGLGLGIVNEAEPMNDFARSRPDEWPMATDPNWPGFRYLGAGQIPDLVALMLDHGYSDADCLGILGGNWRRVCKELWG
jgi:membrane dipeptidase